MLDISFADGGSGPVLILAGEADLTTLAQLNSALDEQIEQIEQIEPGPRLVTVDLSRLRFADSATVAALVIAARSVRDRGGQLEVLHPQPTVARILELTGADQTLAVRGEPAPGPWPARQPAQAGNGSAQSRLRVLLASAGEDAVLRLAGEIDLTTISIAAAAVDQCMRDRPVRMTVDLSAVTFCDCAGRRVLRHAQQQATAAGIGFRLTGLTAPVRRALTLMQATRLLSAADSAGHDEPGRDTRTGRDARPLAPPAPPPDAVSAARRQLNEQYASGIERLLWELDKQPIPDIEAIRRAITATGNGETDSAGPALVLLQAARLGLDRLEAQAFDAARGAGVSDEALAALLGLPDAAAAAAWNRWLTAREALPYDEPPPAHQVVPGGAADAAARAGRRAHQAAARAAEIAQRLEQLSAAAGEPQPTGREHAERSAAHAGEAGVLATEAAERATLALLRAAEALEQCAVGYEQLASADHIGKGEYRQEAAWYWHTAQEHRQLAGQQYHRQPPLA